MSKNRMINTKFWSDTFIENCDPIEKLLFLYLLTNTETNMLGIYEIAIRRIAFDTGIDKDMILKIFGRFENAGKALYIDGYVVIQNFMKHQKYNPMMLKSAKDIFDNLPSSLITNEKMRPCIEGIQRVSKGSIYPCENLNLNLNSNINLKEEESHFLFVEEIKEEEPKPTAKKKESEQTAIFFEEVFKFYKTLTTVGSHKGQAGERFKKLSDVKQQKLFEYLKEYSGRRQKIEAAKGWLRPLPAFEKFIRDGYWENVDLPGLKQEQKKGLPSNIKIS